MKAYSSEAVHVAIVTVAVVALNGSAAMLISNGHGLSSLVILVFMAGMIGGVANNFRRLQKLPAHVSLKDDEMMRLASQLVTIQVYLSPLIGGVFGMTAYAIFSAEILQGELFPTFRATDTTFVDPVKFADELMPATNSDAAKALVWAFIAGFAEGLVPNFIDKIAAEAAKQEKADVNAAKDEKQAKESTEP